MLSISRWMAAAILVTVFTVSAAAVPNFLSEKTFQNLPRWAQHRIVPGIEYQGGTRALLEVDSAAIRSERVLQLRDDVRKALRAAKVGLTQAPIIRGDAVEVRIREDDLQRGVTVLHREFVDPLEGEVRAPRMARIPVARGTPSVVSLTTDRLAPSLSPHFTIEAADGGLVRIAVTEAATRDRIQPSRQAAIDIIKRRMQELGVDGVSVEPRGTERIEVVIPGVDLTRVSFPMY